jgi:hypothetical protein
MSMLDFDLPIESGSQSPTTMTMLMTQHTAQTKMTTMMLTTMAALQE